MTTKKQSWIVRLECTVTKEVEVENCTEQQARENPWMFATGPELEIGMSDWEVKRVEPNN